MNYLPNCMKNLELNFFSNDLNQFFENTQHLENLMEYLPKNNTINLKI